MRDRASAPAPVEAAQARAAVAGQPAPLPTTEASQARAVAGPPVPHPTSTLRWLLPAVAPDVARVPGVRRQAAAALLQWGLGDAEWTVELLLGELAANAARHARTPFNVSLAWDGRTLRCEVTDVNPVPPRPGIAGPDETGGRGLLLVSQLADRWGFEGHRRGKTVWFELVPRAGDGPS